MESVETDHEATAEDSERAKNIRSAVNSGHCLVLVVDPDDGNLELVYFIDALL